MQTSRRPLAVAAGLTLAACALAAPALAEPAKQDPGGPAFILLGALVLIPSLQLVFASLLPAFVRRVERALAGMFWSCFGWGALCLVLGGIVAAILGQGGKPGQALAAVMLVAAVFIALVALSGVAKRLGDRVLTAWDAPPLGPVSVLIGATLLTWGCAIPVVGWAAGAVLLIASLGAGVQVLLHPGTYDPPPAPAPSPAEEPAQ